MRRNWLSRLSLGLALLIGLSLAPPAQARAPVPQATTRQVESSTYYVATTGNDANPGTITAPWRTIQHAADTLRPGNTVLIRGGVYSEHVDVTRSGLSTGYITYQAYPGERPILDGQGVGWDYGFDLGQSAASYIRLRGLTIRNFAAYGFNSWTQSDYLELSNLEMYRNGTAIHLGDNHDNILLQNLYLHNNDLIGVDCAPGPCTRVRIYRSRAINNGPTDDTAADGFAFESGSDIVVGQSVAAGNGGDGFDFKSNTTTITQSISYGNQRNGIKMWGTGSVLANSIARDNGLAGLVLVGGGSYRVMHNLVAHNGPVYRDYGMYAGVDYPATTPVWMRNNIFAFNGQPADPTGVWFTSNVALNEDNDLYFSRDDCEIQADFTGRNCYTRAEITNGTWFRETGQGRYDRSVNPLFFDVALRNYHLRYGSPAVDAGVNAGLRLDLDGNPRPWGPRFDIGPYEAPADPTWIRPLPAIGPLSPPAKEGAEQRQKRQAEPVP